MKLVPYVFPSHLEFLELIFTLGDTTATVRTRKELDADVLTNVSRGKWVLSFVFLMYLFIIEFLFLVYLLLCFMYFKAHLCYIPV